MKCGCRILPFILASVSRFNIGQIRIFMLNSRYTQERTHDPMKSRRTKIPIVVGLFFGDEGKGTVIDFLCSESPVDYVVRFSGGPQTAHNVVTSDGKHHTFAQFGSGTFQGAGTILSKHMLVNPFNMVLEADDLLRQTGIDPFVDTFISENALLITPVHVEANRQREINRGADAHGSCGEGIGETRAYSLYQTPDNPIVVGDLQRPYALERKLLNLIDYLTADIPNFTYDISSLAGIIDGYERLQNDRPLNIVTDDFIISLLSDETKEFVFEGTQGKL
jgi:adenylosuccinate synthase